MFRRELSKCARHRTPSHNTHTHAQRTHTQYAFCNSYCFHVHHFGVAFPTIFDCFYALITYYVWQCVFFWLCRENDIFTFIIMTMIDGTIPLSFSSPQPTILYLSQAHFTKISPCLCTHAVHIYTAMCDHKPFAWMTKQLLPTVIAYIIK